MRTAPTAGMLRSTPRPKRPDQQDVAGVDRQEGGGSAEQDGEQVEGDGAQDRGSGADEQDAGDQAGPARLLASGRARRVAGSAPPAGR